jgi:hypothetical protein
MQAHAHEDVSHSPICVDAIAPLTGNYELVDDSTIQMQAFNEPALGQDLRNFFEQIMVPEFDSIGSEYVQPPPDLTAWMDEVEYFGELDLFGSNFVPSMDQIFEPQLGQQQAVVTPRSVDGSGTAPSVIGNGRVSTTQRRHLAYQNSPWYVYILVLYPTLLTSYVGHCFQLITSMSLVKMRATLSMVRIWTWQHLPTSPTSQMSSFLVDCHGHHETASSSLSRVQHKLIYLSHLSQMLNVLTSSSRLV